MNLSFYRVAIGVSAAIFLPLFSLHGDEAFRVLVFSKTTGFRHASIEAGVKAVQKLAEEHHFGVEATEDASDFAEEKLGGFQAVVFLNTTGDVLDANQQEAFQRFIRKGGGFVGVHSAADTEYDWEWYGELVGAYFKSHPKIQGAVIQVENLQHPATKHLEESWERTDEWYNFRANPREEVSVLLSLDTDSFEGSAMDGDHPIAWYHQFDGGRALYTGLGHTEESYGEPEFLQHLLGAIQWAADSLPEERKEPKGGQSAKE